MYPGFRNYPPRVLLILPVVYPSATIYIIKPLRKLARQGHIIFNYLLESELSVQHLLTSDIVLFCRNSDPVYSWILEECSARGIPTAYDLDDNFWEVPFELHYAKRYRRPERIEQLERYLKHVDTVRVYSDYLREVVKPYNDSVTLVKPCIDFNLVPPDPQSQEDDKIRITYVTGRGNEDPLLPLFAEDLLDLLDKHPGLLEMYWWGEIPEMFRDHPASYLIDIIQDYDQFVHQLALKKLDIGLAPLEPTPFNLSKTNTKFRDYGACRIAGIYSNVEVYSSCVEHEVTGLLVNQEPGAWFEALSRLVANNHLRDRIKKSAYVFVKNNYRQELVEMQWLELLNSMLADQQLILSHQEKPLSDREPVKTKLSIGRLQSPLDGFIVVDEKPYPGVHIVADINQPLPIAGNTIDLALIDQTLERVRDAASSIKEIYRLSKHGSHIWIRASYSWPGTTYQYAQNSYHFNEETPKAWSINEAPVYNDPLLFPNEARNRSLLIEPVEGVDLRCYQMEHFYTPQHLLLDEGQKVRLRREKPGVCDQIIYSLYAVRDASPDEEPGRFIGQKDICDPPWVSQRRLMDRIEALKMEINQLRYDSKNWHFNIQEKENELILTKTSLEHLEEEYKKLGRLTLTARETARQLDAFRSRKAVQIIDRVIERPDFSDKLPPAYQKLLDDSQIFIPSLKGFRLQPSSNLQAVDHLVYAIEIDKAGLCGVIIAPVIDLIPSSGYIGVEIESQNNETVARARVPAESLNHLGPVSLTFPALNESQTGVFQIRIHANDLDVPLRIYEWQNYTLFGFGRKSTQPFIGYNFSPECKN